MSEHISDMKGYKRISDAVMQPVVIINNSVVWDYVSMI